MPIFPHITEAQDGTVHFELDVPRFAPEQITVTADKDTGVVTIRGNAESKKETTGADGRRQNFSMHSHSFSRSFSVNTDVLDLSKLSTKVENGVLNITVPRLAQIEAPPQPSVIAAPAAPPSGDVVATPAAVEAYQSAAKMTWPPQFAVDDGKDELRFSCTLPKAVTADNIHVTLARDGVLSFSVNAVVENVKKDAAGNVTFSEFRSLNYATPLRVAHGTLPQDVRIQLDGNGALVIAVRKHADHAPSKIEVTKV